MQFHVLGPLEVTHDGRTVAVGGARTRAVLAMLLMNGNRVVAADRLVDELWPKHGQERGAANLQVRLSELRRALRSVKEGERLVTRPPGYLLRVTANELDVLVFEQLVSAGREAIAAGDPARAVGLLEQSLALWRGPALADLGDGGFASAERARLEEERLAALESRIEAQLACGRHDETIAELETLTAANPLHERLWRDTGLSDRAPADSPLEERMDDVRAVMQAAQSDHAALFGYSEGAAMSILFAATYPDRVSALILGAATARYRPAPGYPCGEGSEAMFASLTEIAQQRWGQGASIDWFLPSRAASSHARRLFARFERMSITPSAFLRIIRMVREIDVRAVLPTIHVPTLVIQRLDDRMTTPCHGRYLASHIPGARYFEQPGDHALRFAASGDTDRLLHEIDDFLSAVSRPTQPDRVLTTILNIEPAVEARGHVLAHRGRLIERHEVLLATFDAPGHAIRCAHTIRASSTAAGIEPRAGVHTGEVELSGGAIGGPSVDIAAAIAALARPGEILVSRTVTDLVIGSGISFANRGIHGLSGISDPWPLFAVTAV